MKQLTLTNSNRVVLVDDEDFDLLTKLGPWRLTHNGYAVPARFLTIHQVVMPAGEGLVVDHINGDKLDNQKANLRHVTQRENCMNRGANKNNRSGFKGVYFHPGTEKWVAKLRSQYLGLYETPEAASEAYKKAVEDDVFTFSNKQKRIDLIADLNDLF